MLLRMTLIFFFLKVKYGIYSFFSRLASVLISCFLCDDDDVILFTSEKLGRFFVCVCVFFFKVMYAFFYSVSSLYLHVSFVCLLLVLACNQGSGAGRSVGLGDHLPASGGREPVLGSSSPAGEFWLQRSAPRSSGPLAGWLAAPLQRR